MQCFQLNASLNFRLYLFAGSWIDGSQFLAGRMQQILFSKGNASCVFSEGWVSFASPISRIYYLNVGLSITYNNLCRIKKAFWNLEMGDVRVASPISRFRNAFFILQNYYTQFCRIKGCGSAGCPPPIIFERLKFPLQIIYRRKGNLSESPNHQKCGENNLISRFYEHFL